MHTYGRILMVIFCLICCKLTLAEVGTSIGPKVLHVSSEKKLGVPAFGFFGSALSDSKGDIFIHPAPFQEFNIMKISSSSDTTVYQLEDAEAQKYAFYDFSVTPDGTVWGLVNETGTSDMRAVEFDSNGKAKTPVRLQLPENTDVAGFLALDSGVLFVCGNYTDKAAEKLRGQSFLDIFDHSGVLVRNVDKNAPVFTLVKIPGGEMREGARTPGDDGNAYFLDSDSIIAVTPGGEIGKQTKFTKPASDLVAAGLYVSQGWAAIQFHKNNPDHTIDKTFLVIELGTGNVMGWYKPTAETGYGVVAFSPNEGFTFFANDHGRIKLVQAKLR